MNFRNGRAGVGDAEAQDPCMMTEERKTASSRALRDERRTQCRAALRDDRRVNLSSVGTMPMCLSPQLPSSGACNLIP
jgi:hypothetical protein